MEFVFGKRVHLERHRLPNPDSPHVGFVGLGVNLHLGQVLGDGENRRRLQRCRHRLSDIDIARHHDAVDGRTDRRVIQIALGDRDRGVLLADLRLGLDDAGERLRNRARCDQIIRHGQIVILLRLRLLFDEHARAFEIGFGLRPGGTRLCEAGSARCEIGLRIFQIRFCFPERALEKRGIDEGNHLAAVDARIEIRKELRDRAGHLRADLHRGDGVDGARGFHHVVNVAARHPGGQILCFVAAAEFENGSKYHKRGNDQRRGGFIPDNEIAEALQRIGHS